MQQNVFDVTINDTKITFNGPETTNISNYELRVSTLQQQIGYFIRVGVEYKSMHGELGIGP